MSHRWRGEGAWVGKGMREGDEATQVFKDSQLCVS